MVVSACTGLAPFVKSTITFLSGRQTNLITEDIFSLDSGQAPLVEDEYRHTWESKKKIKKHLHAVPGHVWLGQLIPCSRIPSPKFNP